jgi:hypothetical protein
MTIAVPAGAKSLDFEKAEGWLTFDVWRQLTALEP